MIRQMMRRAANSGGEGDASSLPPCRCRRMAPPAARRQLPLPRRLRHGFREQPQRVCRRCHAAVIAAAVLSAVREPCHTHMSRAAGAERALNLPRHARRVTFTPSLYIAVVLFRCLFLMRDV